MFVMLHVWCAWFRHSTYLRHAIRATPTCQTPCVNICFMKYNCCPTKAQQSRSNTLHFVPEHNHENISVHSGTPTQLSRITYSNALHFRAHVLQFINKIHVYVHVVHVIVLYVYMIRGRDRTCTDDNITHTCTVHVHPLSPVDLIVYTYDCPCF